tara:strand:- start:1333 stop:1845 length:513 start_codon:yes stop_codon:yes gene_type:complete
VQVISRAYDWIINMMRILSGIIIFGAFVLIVVDVLVRLAGLKPWGYSIMIVEYSLLWFAMLAAPYLARIKGHVFIDALTTLMPPRLRSVIEKIAYLICIVSSLVFAWYALDLLIDAIVDEQVDVRAEEIPLWRLLLPIPICFVFVATEFMRYLFGAESMYGERTDAKEGV